MTRGRDRGLRIAAALAGRDHRRPVLGALCSACAEMLSLSGAAITVMGDGGVAASMGSSDPVARRLEELEFTVGHGPGRDAYARGVSVLEADLVHDPPARWGAFTGPAVDAGIAAVFAFPLHIGAARLGALTLYQDHPGALSDDSYADAEGVADAVTRTILAVHAGMPEEHLTAELGDRGAWRAEVHQASGMISVQLHIAVGDALAALRAAAFAADRPIGDVAADVVARRLRLDD